MGLKTAARAEGGLKALLVKKNKVELKTPSGHELRKGMIGTEWQEGSGQEEVQLRRLR